MAAAQKKTPTYEKDPQFNRLDLISVAQVECTIYGQMYLTLNRLNRVLLIEGLFKFTVD